MAGNVWEWTAGPVPAYPNSTYADKFYSDQLRVTRGGGLVRPTRPRPNYQSLGRRAGLGQRRPGAFRCVALTCKEDSS